MPDRHTGLRRKHYRTKAGSVAIPMGYRKIAADLHARIQQGEYPPESRLPTYAELARLYSASVSTVQRAVMLLQAHGIIIGVQGAGLYVATTPTT
ncbi:hypothetical protein AWV63_05685 [Micromonospora rifamycinica]|nr:winged helix-turn-helix domain-containing protein [Micromonospora rifamycinica]KWV33676.1 hypothetical protein AWV63_05685 [Micromonospora rifamycinica]